MGGPPSRQHAAPMNHIARKGAPGPHAGNSATAGTVTVTPLQAVVVARCARVVEPVAATTTNQGAESAAKMGYHNHLRILHSWLGPERDRNLR